MHTPMTMREIMNSQTVNITPRGIAAPTMRADPRMPWDLDEGNYPKGG